jgi:glycerol-3-phosphate acyltransferase PlsY
MAFGGLAAVVLGYLLGSIPVGVVVSRLLAGRDPREVGSGRTGGTNVYRTAGRTAAVLTVLGDVFKGYLAVMLAEALAPPASAWPVALAALAAIIGHNHSVFLGFTGGAGSTPNLGAFLRLDPVGFLVVLAVDLAVLFGLRFASVASLVNAAGILAWLGWRVITGNLAPAILVYGIGQLALVAWALRPNIARLRAGTERRLGTPAPEPEG